MPRKRAPTLLDKPRSLRLFELVNSLRVVRDALRAIKSGSLHQALALAGQLRVLLTERSKGNTPLLLELARVLSFPLKLFHGKAVGTPQPGKQALLFALSGFPISLDRVTEDQIESDISTVLKLNLLSQGTSVWNTTDVIDLFANTAGASHSPSKWPGDFASLFQIRIMGAPTPVAVLVQLAEAVRALGVELLREVGTIELHIAIALPSTSLGTEATLFHMFDSNSPAEIRVLLAKDGRLSLVLGSMHGITARVTTTGAIQWPGAHHLGLYVTLSDEVESDLNLSLDELAAGHLRVPLPFLLPSEKETYTILVNRSREDQNAGTRFGLIEIVVLNSSLPLYERAETLLRFREDIRSDAVICTVFEKGLFARFSSEPQATSDELPTNIPISSFLEQ